MIQNEPFYRHIIIDNKCLCCNEVVDVVDRNRADITIISENFVHFRNLHIDCFAVMTNNDISEKYSSHDCSISLYDWKCFSCNRAGSYSLKNYEPAYLCIFTYNGALKRKGLYYCKECVKINVNDERRFYHLIKENLNNDK